MTVTELAIKRPILFIVFFLVLAGAGMFAFTRLNYELLPNLATPYVSITTEYPGASPTEIENVVTKKIEDAVSEVSKIKKISSNSSENLSLIQLEFVADANPDEAMQEVQRAVNKMLSQLPAGVKTPSIEKWNANDVPVLRLGVTSSEEPARLFATIKNQIKPRLAQLKNIGRVTILGGSENEVKIFLNQDRLTSLGLSATEVSEVIRSNNGDFPVGNIKDSDASLGIRISGKFEDLAPVENIKIRTLDDGSTISLKDIATVTQGTRDAEVLSRIDGKSSVGLFINKQTGSNAVEVARAVKQELARLESDYKNINLKFTIAQDTSEFTIQAANAVYKDFGIAVLLVALLMLVFLHSLRNAAIVMLAIPTSLFSAFIMMYFLNYSLNLMTLLAMSLVIGILVDDSIVVLENIYRHLEMGKDRRTASLDGRNEIGFAALSITLVDVVVFLPMALVPGLVGSLVRQFSLVIVVSTLSSLVVSFTLTPMISSRFAQLEHLSSSSFFGRIGLFFENNINRLTNWYKSVLGWSLRHKLATIGITLALLAGSFMLVSEGYVGSEFAPATDKGELSLQISTQPGTKLVTTDQLVKEVEAKLSSLKEITGTFTNVGYLNDGFFESFGTNVASISISLLPAAQRQKSLPDLGREIRRLAMEVPGVKARVTPIGLFGANDAPIQLILSGTNRENVFTDAGRILDSLRSIKGISNPRLSVEKGKPELDIVVDKTKAAALGVNPEVLGLNLRNAINGFDEVKFRDGEQEVNVRIQYDEAYRNRSAELENFSFINRDGQVVYLHQFATITLKSAASALERSNKQASVLLLAQVAGRTSGDVGEDIQKKLAGYSFQDGVRLKYAGDLELQDDSFGSLGIALLSSFVLIYLIMVALYNNWAYPFVILFSIPVALIGAFVALALTAKSLSIFSVFGLIMMMGLVAKNAILLVDRANENLANQQQNLSLTEALLEAGTARLRPILMTTLAMVIGMLPLALAKGAGAELNSGLAWVLIGGLSSSMVLTLVVVPVVYYTITRLIGRWKRNRKRTGFMQPAIVLTGLLFSASSTFGQSQKISLKEAEAIAVQANKQVKSAEIEIIKARLAYRESKGNLLPQINAAGNYTRNIKVPVFFFPGFGFDPASGLTIDEKNLRPVAAGTKNAFNLLVNFSVPLYNAEVLSGITLSKSAESVSKANSALTKSNIIDEVRRAYLDILVLEGGMQLIHESEARARLNLETAVSLFRQGLNTDADTLTAFANYQSLVANKIKAVNAITSSYRYLKLLLAIPVNDSIELSETLETVAPETDTSARSARPEITLIDAQLQQAQANVRYEKSKWAPSASIVSQYNVQAQSNNLKLNQYVWPNSWYVGLNVSVPLFNGFKVKDRVQLARESERQLFVQRQLLTDQVSMELVNAQNSVQSAKQVWLSLQPVVLASQRSLALTTARWKQGIAKYSEVADAELALIQARNNELQAIYTYRTALINLLKAEGK